MSHGPVLNIDIEEVMKEKPIEITWATERYLWLLVLIGVATFFLGVAGFPASYLWGVYYSTLLMWMGVALGSVIIACIVQIVRAKWAPPIRRIAEANAAFLPWAFLLFLVTYFGKETLFPWARAPMPGREWWMQADFVHARFIVLFLLLFYVMRRYVALSLRSDIGVLRETAARDNWSGWLYRRLTVGWKGSENEVKPIQVSLSRRAPLVILLYVTIYSLFAFEMVMGMDTIWFSNMFGGFFFVGNIYMGWAMTSILTIYFVNKSAAYAKTVSTQQLWDLGKLTLGFAILWGYLFFSQYLPQWYGNMPEESQWMILRTRGTWMPVSYAVLALCFVFPFFWLLSEDLKKTPWALSIVSGVILIGVWLEKYVIVLPQLSPSFVPLFGFPFLEIGIFAGFLGIYGLCITGFMKRFPFIPVSHPLTAGSTDW